MEENVRQEKKHACEVQESLNQEQKLRAELENHVKLQSQSLADLEKQRHNLQWRCSFLEDQLRQFVYVEPFIYFDCCNTGTSAVMCSWSHQLMFGTSLSDIFFQETGNSPSLVFVVAKHDNHSF